MQCLLFAVLKFCLSTYIDSGIIIYFFGLMFKRQHNQSPYGKSVTVTETFCTKRTLAGQFWYRTAIAKCMEIQQTVQLPKLYDRRTDGRLCSARNTSLFR